MVGLVWFPYCHSQKPTTSMVIPILLSSKYGAICDWEYGASRWSPLRIADSHSCQQGDITPERFVDFDLSHLDRNRWPILLSNYQNNRLVNPRLNNMGDEGSTHLGALETWFKFSPNNSRPIADHVKCLQIARRTPIEG